MHPRIIFPIHHRHTLLSLDTETELTHSHTTSFTTSDLLSQEIGRDLVDLPWINYGATDYIDRMDPTHPSSLSKEFRDWEKSSLRGVTVAGSYTCGAVIGRGSFGTIRIGQTSRNGSINHVAIKLEKLNKHGSSPCLDKEFKLLKRLQKAQHGIPAILALSTLGPYRALVMQLLGPNLQELFERCGKKFSIQCVAGIALQLFDRFQFLHSEQILYRDVKGENFLIGYPGSRTQNTIHLVDFGLAREWSADQYEKGSPAGTPRYMSLRTHMGKQPSYRDDLESLSFLFIYFAKGKLPWQGIHDGSTIGRIKRIGIKKGSISPEKLCEDLPAGFCRSLKASRMLSYEQVPNFNLFRSIFQTVLRDEQDQINNPNGSTFDWIENNVNLEFGFDKKHGKSKTKAALAIDQGDGLKAIPLGATNLGAVNNGESRLVTDVIPLWNGEPPPTTPRRKAVNFKSSSQLTKSLPLTEPAKLMQSIPTAQLGVTQSLMDTQKKESWGCFAFVKNLMSSDRDQCCW